MIKKKGFFEKNLEYLPLIPILGFLFSFVGAANRLGDIDFFVLHLVTLPVWVLLIMANLKIKRMKKTGGGEDSGLNKSSDDKEI